MYNNDNHDYNYNIHVIMLRSQATSGHQRGQRGAPCLSTQFPLLGAHYSFFLLLLSLYSSNLDVIYLDDFF